MPTHLWKRRLWTMIGFTLLTFGFYYPIWFLRRREALNALDSPRKLPLWPFLVFLGVFGVEFLVGFLSAPEGPEVLIGPPAALTLNLIQLVVGVLMLVQCFVIKDMLEDHLSGPDEPPDGPLLQSRVQLSGLMTFFFTIFYLQYIINRDIVARRESGA